MRPRRLPQHGPNKMLTAYIVALLFPFIIISLLVKYLLLGIALLTPADWNAEEEDLLRKAIWRGFRPHQLKFTFWRRERDIEAKARELNLL